MTISNDSGHIIDERHRSISSPWGSFIGTWQAERKPIELLTVCEFQIGGKRVKDTMPTAGAVETTQHVQAKKNGIPSINVEKVLNTGNGSKMGSVAEANSPVHSPSPRQELESIKAEPVQLATDRSMGSPAPHGSRPESRMALEVQSPLGSRPPSTISEIPS